MMGGERGRVSEGNGERDIGKEGDIAEKER